ncbi:MAG: hypothetical protein HKO10_01165 [Acidimicrobiia bacterium]|nr:hypothetical protein [Acidimicrobiia bacterium]
MRVALHQQLVVQNSTATPVEIQWNGIDSEVAVEDVFVTDGVISDYLGVGVHRLESQPVEITLVVVDPETLVFVVEPMMLRKWGPVTVGSTVEEAESALGGRLVFPDSEFVGGSECQYAYVEHDPYSPGFMILDGTTVARIDATAPEHHTASGIRLGSPTDEVLAAYGDVIERSPHAYVDGEYLTLVPNDEVDAAYRVVFATNEADEVTGFQNGLEGPANWVEGCA